MFTTASGTGKIQAPVADPTFLSVLRYWFFAGLLTVLAFWKTTFLANPVSHVVAQNHGGVEGLVGELLPSAVPPAVELLFLQLSLLDDGRPMAVFAYGCKWIGEAFFAVLKSRQLFLTDAACVKARVCLFIPPVGQPA